MTLADALKKARILLQTRDLLSVWEIGFIKSCLKHSNSLTSKQTARLFQLISKYHKLPMEREPAPLRRTDTTKTRFSRDEILKGRALRHFPLKKQR